MNEKKAKLGEKEFHLNPSVYIAEELVAHGVEIAFGVHGGHIWQIVDEMSRHGIKLITVRHEQNAVYMAENWAQVTRKPAIVYATAGPGMANLVSPVNQAFLSKTPMILILGSHGVEHDKLYTDAQEAYSHDLLGGITKWTQRIVQSNQIKQFIARAFKDVMTYPYAPIALEFSISMLANPIPADQRFWELGAPHAEYIPKWRGEKIGSAFTSGGDPELIKESVELIYQAKNPLILAGDGVHWSKADRELKDFAQHAKIPVSGRRIGRGALSENSRLTVSSRGIAAIKQDVDLVIAIGMKVGFFDGYGRWWKRVIQISESEEHIWTFIPTEVAVIGTPRVILKQMTDYAKSRKLDPPKERRGWLKKVKKSNDIRMKLLHQKAVAYKDLKPLHPGYIAKVVADTCEERYQGKNYVVIDGYTISGFAPAFFKLRKSGQMSGASEQAGVGHGIGMAMGIAFADPSTKKTPVVSLMGDAGMGNAGMEIETAVRYKLPIVFLVTNNDGWIGSMKYLIYGKNWNVLKNKENNEWGLSEFIPNQRYDKMFEPIGCHGEWVTSPEELKKALDRSFDAAEKGIPAVLNVDTNTRVNPPVTHISAVYASCWQHIPWEELPKRGKYLRAYYLKSLYPTLPSVDPIDYWEPISDDEIDP